MSGGIHSQAGYIYQDRIVLYQILIYLINRNVQECSIELEITGKSDPKKKTSYNLDLHIVTINPNRHSYFEIKDKKSISSTDIADVLENFYKFYEYCIQNELQCDFTLIYSSCLAINPRRIDRANKDSWKVIQDLIGISDNIVHDFAGKVSCLCIPDSSDEYLDIRDLELRSYHLINSMLTDQFLISEDASYSLSKTVYDAVLSAYHNRIVDESKRLKADSIKIPPKDPQSVKVGVIEYLDCENGLFHVMWDAIRKNQSDVNYYSNYKTKHDIIDQFKLRYLNSL